MCYCLFFITNFIVSLFVFFSRVMYVRALFAVHVCLIKTIWMTIFEYNCYFNILFRSIMMAFGFESMLAVPISTKKVKDMAPLDVGCFSHAVKEQMTKKVKRSRREEKTHIELKSFFFLHFLNK